MINHFILFLVIVSFVFDKTAQAEKPGYLTPSIRVPLERLGLDQCPTLRGRFICPATATEPQREFSVSGDENDKTYIYETDDFQPGRSHFRYADGLLVPMEQAQLRWRYWTKDICFRRTLVREIFESDPTGQLTRIHWTRHSIDPEGHYEILSPGGTTVCTRVP